MLDFAEDQTAEVSRVEAGQGKVPVSAIAVRLIESQIDAVKKMTEHGKSIEADRRTVVLVKALQPKMVVWQPQKTGHPVPRTALVFREGIFIHCLEKGHVPVAGVGDRNGSHFPYRAMVPSASSIRSRRLYFAMRSERESEPVLICPQPVATARSAIKVSSVSPERCETMEE